MTAATEIKCTCPEGRFDTKPGPYGRYGKDPKDHWNHEDDCPINIAGSKEYERRRQQEAADKLKRRKEIHRKILEIATEVGPMLVPPWEVEETPIENKESWNEVHLVRGSMRIEIAPERDKTDKRIVVRGEWPVYHDSGQQNHPRNAPRITLANDRPARAIASGIMNRFLPEYLKLWDEMRKQTEAHLQRCVGCQIHAKKLMELGFERYEYNGRGSGESLFMRHETFDAITVDNAGKCRLDNCDLSIEEIEMLINHRKKTNEDNQGG